MWDNLLRVDWGHLTHAYGWACDVPDILRSMIAHDESARGKGWDTFWSAINHQGDFYDSTVAAVPFLIEAVAHSGTPERAQILYYFRDRWLDAPEYGGDPVMTAPPGGVDIPTPVRSAVALASTSGPFGKSAEGRHDNFAVDSYRRMDLCAWQTARAIQVGRSTFVSLAEDADREVAAAAAALLLQWPETRIIGKRALVRAVADETDSVEQARRILEFGVYSASEDVSMLARWSAPDQPSVVRAAAGLVWAWVVNPRPLPQPAELALRTAAARKSDAFGKLPWVGVYRGPWALPANAAELILELVESRQKEVRWRAVQGLAIGRPTAGHLSAARVVPALLKRLSDDYNRIRAAAALALAQHGETVLDVDPDAIAVLIRALDEYRSHGWGDAAPGLDSDASVSGHAARLLAALSLRLTSVQRQEAVAGIDHAARRYAGRDEEYVHFTRMAVPAAKFLRDQRVIIANPRGWGLVELLAEFAFPDREERRLSPGDCDRRLADVYARAPDETIAAAIEAVRAASNVHVAIGAAQWLMTLGPAAESALEALDAMASGQSYAQKRVRAAGTYIRQSLLVTRDGGEELFQGDSERARVAQLLRVAAGAGLSGGSRDALIAESVRLTQHPDAYVRSGAAEGLALLMPAPDEVAAAVPALEQMLADETFVEVGIAGVYECGGRLFHWRRERRSPRAGAIHALFAAGRIPEGDRMIRAMLAQSTHPKILCGELAEPHRFPIAQWRLAADAAGGLSAADPSIRAVQQQCRLQLWPGNNAAQVCAAELSEIIRQLSGRLVP